MELKDKATTDVSRQQAQAAIDDAKEVVELARQTIVGEELSQNTDFKIDLMIGLLDTSIAEYGEAVSEGMIDEMAEFQDGSAFVWRSQQIFDEIKPDIDAEEAGEIEELYKDLWAAYDARADPSEIETLTNGIIHELEESQESKLDFAAGLEETLGHFWALEQNLDEGNAELALTHATHPIAELYDAMKPILQSTDPQLDSQVQTTLMELKDKATTDVSRQQAQAAIDDAKEVVSVARSTVVGDYLSSKTDTKLVLMKTLLETSIAEYGEAVSEGMIDEMAEFQDGSAFVWRSQQIFSEVKSDVDSEEAAEIDELYEELWMAYDSRADPSQVETLAGGIIHEIDEILGVEGKGNQLSEYIDNIQSLMMQTKQEYSQGNTDVALSLATKAYLDNYEFVEGPLTEAGKDELMERVEVMIREELRNMIKNKASTAQVNSQVNAILDEMKSVEKILVGTSTESDTMKSSVFESLQTIKGWSMSGGFKYSPDNQGQNGIHESDVICKEGLVLLERISSNMPICVDPSSVDRLMSLGFAQRF